MGLDRLGAEEQRFGDLPVRLAVHDELGDLTFARCQRLDAGSVAVARSRTSGDVLAELAQLGLCCRAVAKRATSVQIFGGAPQLGDGAFGLSRSGESATGEGTRHRGLDGHANLVGGGGGGERALDSRVRPVGGEGNRGVGSIRHAACHAKPQVLGGGLSQRRCACCLWLAVQGEPAAGQQLERPGSPDAREEREFVTAGG